MDQKVEKLEFRVDKKKLKKFPFKRKKIDCLFKKINKIS
jgi:hypothetical protein